MRRLPALVVTAAVLSLAACGGGDDTSSAAPASDRKPATAAKAAAKVEPAAARPAADKTVAPALKKTAVAAPKKTIAPAPKKTPAPVATPTPVAEPTPTRAPDAPRPTTAPQRPRGAKTVNGAVDAWLDASAAGDSETAWGVLAAESRQAIGGYDSFVQMRSALAEGWGAWAAANEDRRTVLKVYDTPSGPVHVVVLSGLVQQEGPEDYRATAVVVRETDDGRYVVSTFERAGYIEMVNPWSDGDVVDDKDSLVARTEPESTVFMSVGYGLHRATAEASEMDAVWHHSYQPTGDGALRRGTWIATVVTVGPGELIQAAAVVFEVK